MNYGFKPGQRPRPVAGVENPGGESLAVEAAIYNRSRKGVIDSAHGRAAFSGQVVNRLVGVENRHA